MFDKSLAMVTERAFIVLGRWLVAAATVSSSS